MFLATFRNHEPYSSDWPVTLAALRDFEQEVDSNSNLGDFFLLDRTMFRLLDTDFTILDCSLFSFIPPEKEMTVGMRLNDFYSTEDSGMES